jgi:hypothetical protein
MADVPATAAAVLSVAVALWAEERRRRGAWLAVAGILFGISLGIKPTSAYLAAPLLVAAWSETQGPATAPWWRLTAARARRLALLAGGALATVALFMAPVDLKAFAGQALGTYAASTERYPLSLPENLGRLWAYFSWSKYGAAQYGFPLLLALGAAALVRGPHSTARLALFVWLGGGTLFWLLHAPLYSHQLVTLLAPGTALAAYGLISAWRGLAAVGRSAGLSQAMATLALLWTLGGAGVLAEQNGGFAAPPDDDEDEDAQHVAALLRKELPDDAYIVTDSLALAFEADRDLPPMLANLSSRAHHQRQPRRATGHRRDATVPHRRGGVLGRPPGDDARVPRLGAGPLLSGRLVWQGTAALSAVAAAGAHGGGLLWRRRGDAGLLAQRLAPRSGRPGRRPDGLLAGTDLADGLL